MLHINQFWFYSKFVRIVTIATQYLYNGFYIAPLVNRNKLKNKDFYKFLYYFTTNPSHPEQNINRVLKKWGRT